MAEGRQRDAWDRHSLLLALVRNAMRGANEKAFRASDFNPFTPPPREKTFDELFPPTLIPVS